MTEKTVPLTPEGRDKLLKELEELRSRRKLIAERIHHAQELGTSQTDAEYEDAKQEQGMVEGRILEIEDILRRAVIIDETKVQGMGRVVVGSRVEVEQDGQVRVFRIVGAPEADPSAGKISNESPVGRALLGRTAGEVVEVNVPKGVIKLKILKVE